VSLIEDDGTPQQGTPEGSCTGTLSGSVITVNCVHNNAAASAHLHPVPANIELCGIPNPPQNFQIVCPLTPDQLDLLLTGKMFVAVVGGPGPPADGYILPAP
jgi:hypothetical protein